VPVYHKHTGSVEWGEASGCYTQCGCTYIYVKDYKWVCGSCGAILQYYKEDKPSICKTALLTCTKTSSTIDGYICDITEGAILFATISFQ